MRYYIKTIEQTLTGEGEERVLSEYGNMTNKATENAALSAYYEGLTTISKDLWTPETPNKHHTYFRTSIEEPTGRVMRTDVLGTYLESVPVEPEPEPTE